jgi:hypothetical protein
MRMQDARSLSEHCLIHWRRTDSSFGDPGQTRNCVIARARRISARKAFRKYPSYPRHRPNSSLLPPVVRLKRSGTCLDSS